MTREDTSVPGEPGFPSGPWAGFYVHGGLPARHQMELDLNFKEGLVRGAGLDDIASFVISGRYDAGKLEVWWHKRYLTHDVFYRGFREGRGIWGTWEIGRLATGGFKIWPREIGESEEAGAEEEEPLLEEAPLPLPATLGP